MPDLRSQDPARLLSWPLPDGTNVLRGVIRDHYGPSVEGQRLIALVLYTIWFDVGAELDEKLARTPESWSAWQFHDPRTGEGFVQAFRVRSPEQIRSVILKGIDPKSRYQFTDPYSGETFEVHGAELTSRGLSLDLPLLSSRVLIYRKSG